MDDRFFVYQTKMTQSLCYLLFLSCRDIFLSLCTSLTSQNIDTLEEISRTMEICSCILWFLLVYCCCCFKRDLPQVVILLINILSH